MRTNIRLENKVWSQYDRSSGPSPPPTDQSAVTEPRESQDHANQGYLSSQGLTENSQPMDQAFSQTSLSLNGSQDLNQPPSDLAQEATQPSLTMNSLPELSQSSQPPNNSGSIVKLDCESGKPAESTSTDCQGQDAGASATTDHPAVSNLSSTVDPQDPEEMGSALRFAGSSFMNNGSNVSDTEPNPHGKTSSLIDTGSNVANTGSNLHDDASNPGNIGSTLLDNGSNLHDAGSSHLKNGASTNGSLDSPPMFDFNLPITNHLGFLSSTPATNNENPPNLVDLSMHPPDFSSESKITKSSIENSTSELSSCDDVSCTPEEAPKQIDCSIEKTTDAEVIINTKSNSSSTVTKRISLESKSAAEVESANSLPSTCINLFKRPKKEYMQIISEAILASENERLMLDDIYKYICKRYPYYRTVRGVDNKAAGWRNSVRHNLSTGEMFMKKERGAKSHYWMIHPACIEDFRLGIFNSSAAKRKIRQYEQNKIDKYLNTMAPVRELPNVDASPIPYVPSGAVSRFVANIYDQQIQMQFQNSQRMYQEGQDTSRQNYSQKSFPLNDLSMRQYLNPNSPGVFSNTATNSYPGYDSGFTQNFNNSARSPLYAQENEYVDYKGNVSSRFDGNYSMASNGYNNANNMTVFDSGFQSAVQSPLPSNSSLVDRPNSTPLFSNQKSSEEFVSTPQLYNESFPNTTNEKAGLQLKNPSSWDASRVDPFQSSNLKWPPSNVASQETSNKKLAFHFSECVQYPQPVSQQSSNTEGRQQNPASVNTQQFATVQNQKLYNQMNSTEMSQYNSFQSTESQIPRPGMQYFDQSANQFDMQQNVNTLGVGQTAAQRRGQFNPQQMPPRILGTQYYRQNSYQVTIQQDTNTQGVGQTAAQGGGQFNAQQMPQYGGYQGNYTQVTAPQQQMPSSSQNTTYYYPPQNF